VEQILGVAGRPTLEPEILGNGAVQGEIARQYLDSSKAKEVLGWEPATPLAAGLEYTISWYREHPEAL
jgi:nucleoside-diphosphate-sugar epimerase